MKNKIGVLLAGAIILGIFASATLKADDPERGIKNRRGYTSENTTYSETIKALADAKKAIQAARQELEQARLKLETIKDENGDPTGDITLAKKHFTTKSFMSKDWYPVQTIDEIRKRNKPYFTAQRKVDAARLKFEKAKLCLEQKLLEMEKEITEKNALIDSWNTYISDFWKNKSHSAANGKQFAQMLEIRAKLKKEVKALETEVATTKAQSDDKAAIELFYQNNHTDK